jgi:hypothetical protein
MQWKNYESVGNPEVGFDQQQLSRKSEDEFDG